MTTETFLKELATKMDKANELSEELGVMTEKTRILNEINKELDNGWVIPREIMVKFLLIING